MVIVLVPEFVSKKTLSLILGIGWPPAPPEITAHLVPAVLSHVFVPPTQNLLAIFLF